MVKKSKKISYVIYIILILVLLLLFFIIIKNFKCFHKKSIIDKFNNINKNPITFLTFANTNFMNTERIINQANESKVFDNIILMNENDIDKDFMLKHKEFIDNNPKGYGLYIWKPKIIYDTLNNINENDILVYCDAGFHLNIKAINNFYYYIEKLNQKDMVTFSTSAKYLVKNYVKMDAIMSYYPEFDINNNDICCYAGIMIIKKNQKTLLLIKDWLDLCENYDFLDRSGSKKHNDIPEYHGNDLDSGLFNLCLVKHKISFNVYPDETNVYAYDGITQMEHATTDFDNIDWSKLDNYFFQTRRLRSRSN